MLTDRQQTDSETIDREIYGWKWPKKARSNQGDTEKICMHMHSWEHTRAHTHTHTRSTLTVSKVRLHNRPERTQQAHRQAHTIDLMAFRKPTNFSPSA